MTPIKWIVLQIGYLVDGRNLTQDPKLSQSQFTLPLVRVIRNWSLRRPRM